jgi:hypothetical protein
MSKIATENGVSAEDIELSSTLGYHELPTTLPFSQEFVKQIQSEFLDEYFLSKERLLNVIPHQMRIFTEDEIVQVYNGYLPIKAHTFDELLDNLGLNRNDFTCKECLPEKYGEVKN